VTQHSTSWLWDAAQHGTACVADTTQHSELKLACATNTSLLHDGHAKSIYRVILDPVIALDILCHWCMCGQLLCMRAGKTHPVNPVWNGMV
jgi:hypothetical protein